MTVRKEARLPGQSLRTWTVSMPKLSRTIRPLGVRIKFVPVHFDLSYISLKIQCHCYLYIVGYTQ